MANAEYPWFRFMARDWLIDDAVVGMGAMCRGCYIQLLAYQWENGGLPEDPYLIARFAGISDRDVMAIACINAFIEEDHDANDIELCGVGHFFVEEIWPVLENLFPSCAGGLRKNPVLERERASKVRQNTADRERTRLAREAKARKRVSSVTKVVTTLHPELDADADEEKRRDVVRKRTTPPPREVVCQWNLLADRHGLPRIAKLTANRKKRASARLREFPDLWAKLELLFAGRGQWAREKGFPTFDQIMRPEILTKFEEGNYERKASAKREDREIPDPLGIMNDA